MNITKTTDASKIKTLIFKGIECWVQAGEIVAQYLTEHPAGLNGLAEELGLSADILLRFAQIGKRELHPRLLVNPCPGYKALSSVEYNEQEFYLSQPLELLCHNGEAWDVLKVAADRLTASQCKQLFHKGRVRSHAEQRAYLEDLATKAKLKQSEEDTFEELPYTIIKGKIYVRKNVCLGVRDLRRMLKEIAR